MFKANSNEMVDVGSPMLTNVTTLVGCADNGGGYACVGDGSGREISITSPQFCWEHKTVLKKCQFFIKFTYEPIWILKFTSAKTFHILNYTNRDELTHLNPVSI